MNDQSQMINNQPPQLMLNSVQPPIQLMPHSQAQPQMMNPVQLVQSQPLSSAQMMNQPSLMLNRSYTPWLQDPNRNTNLNFAPSSKPNFSIPNNRSGGNWKGKKVGGNVPENKRKDSRKFDKPLPMGVAGMGLGGVSGVVNQGHKPPTLNELQTQNRLKARKFYGNKKKFNNSRFAPYAPRNTTSYIIRAKKEGGIASLVSPCPVTPAVLPTPMFSPSREVLGDMAKEEWGVDGYGSMKGLIRLRSPGNEPELVHEDDEEEEGSSESDVEEHVEMERRLDHDLSRFEMIYPSYGGGSEYNNMLENRVDDQDTHIAQLEEENLTLKERLFLMERELGDLRRRLQFLESHSRIVEDVNEEVVENGSENDSEGGASDVRVDYNNEDMMNCKDGNVERGRLSGNKDAMATEVHERKDGLSKTTIGHDVFMEDIVPEQVTGNDGGGKYEETREGKVEGEAMFNSTFGEGIAREEEGDNHKGVGKMVENEEDQSKCEVGEQSVDKVVQEKDDSKVL